MNTQLKTAIKRVEAVSDGKTINGTYRMTPGASLEAFKSDLRLIIENIKGVDRD